MNNSVFDELKFDADGLLPAIAVDDHSGAVLMVAWVNLEAFQTSMTTGFVHYFSRSRQQLWQKGESSGHTQAIQSVHLDCDGDVLLFRVHQAGGIACHTGRASCFYRQLKDGAWVETQSILKDPAEIYTDA
ncbi:MAG: phosphoribosyl-AMP cyclohydrolase [Gammaproteobacteria bacterium TMED95]|jgi:phosphoribosyl-AMP cyclohydrolase|nr:phosphoribosyl-AMP cyclohydrolase [Gammaproteobacteria bacterium]OUV21963.1 MAG: phosphoribosyl-AMP cyclohydrolase [Gammaproteobacteria bacterium TMED95]|tara:strand:- start:1742 stop:2134 length:393 start_codon:yes stop_codon:yes gene_type:complete